MNTDFDVIIVGGSLSGAASAKRLADSGRSVLVIEKMALPRHKTCSGIISPRGHRFLLENFGPLPEEAMHDPQALLGVMFHYQSMLSMPMDFHHGPTPHLNRRHADHWALKRSGAQVHDSTRLTGLEDKGTHVELQARRNKQDVTYRARYVIGADGPKSVVVRSIYTGYRESIPWFTVKQFYQDIIESGLDRRYFHFWVHPELGFYTWTHERNGRQIIGVGYAAGDDLTARHEKVSRYLETHHGVRLEPSDEREGVTNNFGPSLINRYVFGKGNVIVTGQAAGFLNMIAEGMSCALHSGAIAGEAAVESLLFNRDLQKTYRGMVASEVRRCSDQWNPLKIIFGSPHEANFMAAFRRHTKRDRMQIVKDIGGFLKPWARYKWGRQMVSQAIVRHFIGAYMPSRWL